MAFIKTFLTQPRRTLLRRALFQIHLWSGLLIGLIAAVVGLSGSALVFREEIEAQIYPEMTFVAAAENRISVQQTVEAVKNAYPEHRLNWIDLSEKASHAAVLASATGEEGNEKYWYITVNPHTGEVLGVRSRDKNASWMNWLAELHFYLLAGETGLIVNGVGAILLFLLCLTGVVIWFPGRGKIKRSLTVKWRNGWKRFNWDLHNISGFVFSVLLGALAFTGVYFAFYETFEKAAYAVFITEKLAEPKSVVSENAQTSIVIDDLVANAKAKISEGKPRLLTFPHKPEDAYTIYLTTPDDWNSYGSSYVYFDRYSGEPLRVDDNRQMPLVNRFLNVLGPIHFGTFGGITTRILWIFVGIAPAVLFITGFLMWWNRVVVKRWRKLRAGEAATSAAPKKPELAIARKQI